MKYYNSIEEIEESDYIKTLLAGDEDEDLESFDYDDEEEKNDDEEI